MKRPLRPMAVLLMTTAATAVAVSGGCSGSAGSAEAQRGVTTEEFVEIVMALREAERGLALEDSAESIYADRKSEILGRYGATESDLRAFVERHEEKPAKLQAVWDTIAQRLKHVPAEADRLETEGVMEGEGDPEERRPEAAPGRRGPPGARPGGPAAGERRLH